MNIPIFKQTATIELDEQEVLFVCTIAEIAENGRNDVNSGNFGYFKAGN